MTALLKLYWSWPEPLPLKKLQLDSLDLLLFNNEQIDAVFHQLTSFCKIATSDQMTRVLPDAVGQETTLGRSTAEQLTRKPRHFVKGLPAICKAGIAALFLVLALAMLGMQFRSLLRIMAMIVIRDFVGHGIGRNLSRTPRSETMVVRVTGLFFVRGMVIAIRL